MLRHKLLAMTGVGCLTVKFVKLLTLAHGQQEMVETGGNVVMFLHSAIVIILSI